MNRPPSMAGIGATAAVIWASCVGIATAQSPAGYADLRNRMVDRDVIGAGVSNPRVIEAMRITPRHEFIPEELRRHAYFDMALPIGKQQTISPPFVVANMTEKLDPQPTDSVLEIGTGSGYQSAVLSSLVKDVYTIEIVEALGERAARVQADIGYKNIHTKIGDGFLGWAEHAPFDKIIVTCSPEKIPQPLIDQLREGGRMVIPLGERYYQTLYLFKKKDGKLVSEAIEPTMFVPMTGQAERLREVQPDPSRPAILNGSFEEITQFQGIPDGWYYVRQAKIEDDPDAPDGKKRFTFTNRVAGQMSQALTAMGLDGRAVHEVEMTFWIRGQNLAAGQNVDQQAKIIVNFFDENRAPIEHHVVGPFSGTLGWTEKRARITVPSKTRIAVIAIGLIGGTGEVSFDKLAMRAISVNPSALPKPLPLGK
jgi:protein-L-isoaspartate(D-aspartate) O-methyltransferase